MSAPAASVSPPARHAVFIGTIGQKGSELGEFDLPWCVTVHPISGRTFFAEIGDSVNRVTAWAPHAEGFALVYDVMTDSLQEQGSLSRCQGMEEGVVRLIASYASGDLSAPLFAIGERPHNDGIWFQYPGALCAHGSHLYVCDLTASAVRVLNISAEGAVVDEGQLGKGTLRFPSGVACSDDEIFVADANQPCIDVFNVATRAHVRRFGSYGSGRNGQLLWPRGLCVDAGLIYVAEDCNHRVSVFTVQGQFVRCIGSGVPGSADDQFTGPYDVCVSGGHLYVADSGNNRVQVFTAEGALVCTMGTGSRGSAPGQLNEPTGVAVCDGRVYVADSGNHRVSVFAASK